MKKINRFYAQSCAYGTSAKGGETIFAFDSKAKRDSFVNEDVNKREKITAKEAGSNWEWHKS